MILISLQGSIDHKSWKYVCLLLESAVHINFCALIDQ